MVRNQRNILDSLVTLASCRRGGSALQWSHVTGRFIFFGWHLSGQADPRELPLGRTAGSGKRRRPSADGVWSRKSGGGEGGGGGDGGESGGDGGGDGGANCEKETSSSAMSELKLGPVRPLKRTFVVEAGRTTAASSQELPWLPVLLQSVDQPVSVPLTSTERVPMLEPYIW